VRLTQRVTKLTRRVPDLRGARPGQVVIFDAATGQPLPGYAPDPLARVHIWLPAKDPLPDPGAPPRPDLKCPRMMENGGK
jgi:hypothetical protein